MTCLFFRLLQTCLLLHLMYLWSKNVFHLFFCFFNCRITTSTLMNHLFIYFFAPLLFLSTRWHFDLFIWDAVSHCLSSVPRLSYDVKYLGQAACRVENFLSVSWVSDPDVSEILVLHHVTSLHVHKRKETHTNKHIHTQPHTDIRTAVLIHTCMQTNNHIHMHRDNTQYGHTVVQYMKINLLEQSFECRHQKTHRQTGIKKKCTDWQIAW